MLNKNSVAVNAKRMLHTHKLFNIYKVTRLGEIDQRNNYFKHSTCILTHGMQGDELVSMKYKHYKFCTNVGIIFVLSRLHIYFCVNTGIGFESFEGLVEWCRFH